MADARAVQPRPVELLAGIDLAQWRHIGMRQHVTRRDAVARHDVPREGDHRLHLFRREMRVTQRMAGIVDLDADGARIAVGLAFPARLPGMPGAHLFAHHLGDHALLVHQIVARHARSGLHSQAKRPLR